MVRNSRLFCILSSMDVTIARTFFRTTIPDGIIESAKIDGASQWTVFFRIILPISKPVLATIGLFLAFGYWNDWFQAKLYISNDNLLSLQAMLDKMQNNDQDPHGIAHVQHLGDHHVGGRHTAAKDHGDKHQNGQKVIQLVLRPGQDIAHQRGEHHAQAGTQGGNQPLTPMVATLDVKVYQMLTSGTVSLGKTAAASLFQAVVGRRRSGR